MSFLRKVFRTSRTASPLNGRRLNLNYRDDKSSRVFSGWPSRKPGWCGAECQICLCLESRDLRRIKESVRRKGGGPKRLVMGVV